MKVRHDPNDYSRYVSRHASRSRKHLSDNLFEQAISEAEKVIELKPHLPDGHALVGDVHKKLGLINFKKAAKAYRKGLAMDRTNEEIRSGLAKSLGYVFSPFGDAWREGMWERLSRDPRTSDFAKEEDFVEIMSGMKHSWDFNPNWQDERVLRSVVVLLSSYPEIGEADSDPPAWTYFVDLKKLWFRSDTETDTSLEMEADLDDEWADRLMESQEETREEEKEEEEEEEEDSQEKSDEEDEESYERSVEEDEEPHEEEEEVDEDPEETSEEYNDTMHAYYQKEMIKAETKGDRFFSSDDLSDAVKSYTAAIKLAPDDHHKHVLFSKRSAAYLKDKKHDEALADAKSAVNLDPEWAEGHSRIGAAHYALGKIFFGKAKDCYRSADFYADTYQFSDALDQLSKYRWSPLEDAFKREDMLNVLRASNRTSGFMEEDDFNTLMTELSQNPRRIHLYMEDENVIDALYVLLNDTVLPPRLPLLRNVQSLIDVCTLKFYKAPDPPLRFDQLLKRAGYHMYQNQYLQALSDAKRVTQIKPSRSKGHVLMGDALKGLGLQEFELAVDAYKKGLSFQSTSETMKSKLAHSLAHLSSPFGDALGPNMWGKLSKSPRTSAYMKQEGFVQQMEKFSESPLTFNLKLNDVRVIEAILVLLSDQTVHHEMGMDFEAVQNEETNQAQAVAAQALKAIGDASLSSGDFSNAVTHYTAAINLDPNNHALFSKRSSAYTSLQNYKAAVLDAKKSIQLKPTSAKGYRRLGTAHYQCGVKHFKDAVESYQKAAKINPTKNQFNWDVRELPNYVWNPFETALREKKMFEKLSGNPLTSEMMKDLDFVAVMEDLQRDPSLIYLHMNNNKLGHALFVLVNGTKKRHRGMEEECKVYINVNGQIFLLLIWS